MKGVGEQWQWRIKIYINLNKLFNIKNCEYDNCKQQLQIKSCCYAFWMCHKKKHDVSGGVFQNKVQLSKIYTEKCILFKYKHDCSLIVGYNFEPFFLWCWPSFSIFGNLIVHNAAQSIKY